MNKNASLFAVMALQTNVEYDLGDSKATKFNITTEEVAGYLPVYKTIEDAIVASKGKFQIVQIAKTKTTKK
jgi:hypothetical protein